MTHLDLICINIFSTTLSTLDNQQKSSPDLYTAFDNFHSVNKR